MVITHNVVYNSADGHVSCSTLAEETSCSVVLGLYPSSESDVEKLYSGLDPARAAYIDFVADLALALCNEDATTEIKEHAGSKEEEVHRKLAKRLALIILANPHNISTDNGQAVGMGLYPR